MGRLIKYFQNLIVGNFDEDFYINEIEELKMEIRELNQVIHDKNHKLNKMYNELDSSKKEIKEAMKSSQNGNKFDSSLLEKLGEEIKARDIKIKTLLAEIEKLKIHNNLLNSSVTVSPALATLDDLQINYKLLIVDYFSERKFESFKKLCEHKKLVYVEELSMLDFSSLKLTKTKIENAKKRYQEFLDKTFDEATVQYLQYGEHLSKVFFRYRSFVRFCEEKNINFVSELDEFDFRSLEKENFSFQQIDKIESKYIEYIKLKKK